MATGADAPVAAITAAPMPVPVPVGTPAVSQAEAAVRGNLVARLKRHSMSLLTRTAAGRMVARSEWRRRRLLVLCYHGVSLDDEHQWNPRLYVSAATLRRRLETLHRLGCHVLPLGEAVDRLAAGALPPLSVVLTFDDGFHDFQARAWPLLQEFGYPATVYVPTQRCEHNYPVVRLFLSYVLWKRRHVPLDGRGIPGLEGTRALGTDAERQQVVQAIDGAMRAGRLGMRAKDDIVRQVVTRLGLDYQQLFDSRVLRLMLPADLAALAGPQVDFQLHTHTHQTPADPDLFVREIRENRERLEAMTGRHASHFCYPSGVYRPEYPALLRQEGVISATTCDPGIASLSSNPLLLPRFIDTESVSDATFEAWATGVAGLLPHRHARRAGAAAA